MKLRAARGLRDAQDIDILLTASGVATVEEAVEVFEHDYPDEELSTRALAQLDGRLGGAPPG